MKKSFLVLIFLLSHSILLADPVYKEVLVNGEKMYRWVEFYSCFEYDINGNEIYWKHKSGSEKIYC